MNEHEELQAVSEQFIQDHGLESVAGLQVEAHGSIYTVEEAVVRCEPFAKMIVAMSTSFEELPLTKEQKQEVLVQSVRKMALEAPDDTETKKKLTSSFLSQTPQTNLI